MRFAYFPLALALAALSACGDSAAPTGCAERSDCLRDETCVNGRCMVRMDAGPGDPSCGMPCDTGNPCAEGIFDCSSGEPVCVGQGPAAAGVVCRAAAGSCDVAEECDGSTTECPADAFAADSVSCRAATGECDAEEFCTGTSGGCPPDKVAPTGTACAGGFCNGGACEPSCTPGAACHPDENLCRRGVIACVAGVPTCQETGLVDDGTTCAPTEFGAWSECRTNPSPNPCAGEGSRHRSVIDFACQAGECESTGHSEVGECEVDTDGNVCTGRDQQRCYACQGNLCTAIFSCLPGMICCGSMCAPDCPRR